MAASVRIILAALVTPADVMENVPLRDLLWRVCFRRKLRPGQVTGDTTYGTVENIVAVEDAGIRAFFPLPDFDHRTPFFGKGEFTYDAARDAVSLPAGTVAAAPQDQVHRGRGRLSGRRRDLQRVPGQNRSAPPATTVGIVHRSFSEDYLEKVRGYHITEAYPKAIRKRKVWVEPLFAEAKEWHGLRRFRLRGLTNVNIEGLLIAAGQNLKRFLAATGWGGVMPRWEPRGLSRGPVATFGRLRLTHTPPKQATRSADVQSQSQCRSSRHFFKAGWPIIGPATRLDGSPKWELAGPPRLDG